MIHLGLCPTMRAALRFSPERKFGDPVEHHTLHRNDVHASALRCSAF